MLDKISQEDLLKELARRESVEQGVNPNIDDPQHQAAAEKIAADFADENNRRHNDPDNKLPVIKGDHTPMSWCIQPDGTLTVVLKSGPKINAPIPGSPAAKAAAKKAKAEAE